MTTDEWHDPLEVRAAMLGYRSTPRGTLCPLAGTCSVTFCDPTRPTSSGSLRRIHKCLAVVPAYNEQASVAAVVGSARASTAPDFDVLVIDDGSTDRTAEVAEAAGARVLRLPFNLGIGGAVQAGFTYALENGYDCMRAGRRRRPARPARDRTAAATPWRTTRRSTWSAGRAS